MEARGAPMEKWDWQEVEDWLEQYKRSREMDSGLIPVLQCWIDIQLVRYGDDLPQDDSEQELWLFVLDYVLPRVDIRRTRREWRNFILLCIKNEIAKIRNRLEKRKRELSNMEENGNGAFSTAE